MNFTFSALCRYLGATTPTARRTIVRQQKFPTDGPMLSYVQAEQAIVAHLVDGTPLSKNGLLTHCQDVLAAFEDTTWPRKGLAFARPSTHLDRIELFGVQLSVKPSLLVADKDGNRGACKLFFNKAPDEDKPQLDEAIAKKMASLLYYYGREYLKQAEYRPTLCSVWCVRDGEIVASTGRVSKLIADIQAACQEIASVWASV